MGGSAAPWRVLRRRPGDTSAFQFEEDNRMKSRPSKMAEGGSTGPAQDIRAQLLQ